MSARRLGTLVLLWLAAALVQLVPHTARAAPPSRPLRLGSGSEGGRFSNLAAEISDELKSELPLDVVITEGSCGNIRGLASGDLDVALVKYDVAAEAMAAAAVDDADDDGDSGWMCNFKPSELAGVKLQLVAAIEEAAAHLIVRRPVRLDDLGALGQRPIFVGQRGSGSMETAKILLGAAGLTLEDVNAVELGNKAAMEAMGRGELLMVLRTTTVGTRAVSKLLGTGMADLNPLPPSVITRLGEGFPYYRVCSIGADSYRGMRSDVPTVCVSTVLLTAQREDDEEMADEQVITMIDGLTRLEDDKRLGPLRWSDFAERTPVPLHPGAKLRGLDRRKRTAGEIRFGGSSKHGAFTVTANALATAVEDSGADFKLDVRITGGSCDNIRKLARGELDAALVQYAVAAEAFTAAQAAQDAAEADEPPEGESGWMCGLEMSELVGLDLQLVAAIDDAAAHVIVRRPVRLDDFGEIGDRPIFLGQRGSGSMETSKVILGAAGLSLDDVESLDISNTQSMEAMRRGELLMMLRTTAVGDKKIKGLLATGSAGLNALPGSIIERLIEGFPYFRVCQIDPASYPGLSFALPTVCVSTVVLTARRSGEDLLTEEQVVQLIDGLRWLEKHPDEHTDTFVRFRDFAEREPIPLHDGAAWAERSEFAIYWAKVIGVVAVALVLLSLLRRYLRRRGVLGNPLSGNLEGQLSNPLVPFFGFLVIVGAATLLVWNLEHDSNARVRTLNDSFWEMNMFATGNFDSESLKTSTARVIGVAATVAGLGLLAWFTAALTSILSRDQTRLFRRTRDHIVILNFREEMLQLIRVLRSPGPQRQRPIHVVVSEALPTRVKAQLTRVRGLTIYEQNPEVPEELVELRLPRAARVIVLQGTYHPLRIARAVHQACMRLDPAAPRTDHTRGAQLDLAPSVQSPTLAGDAAETGALLPVTLVEAAEDDMEGLFAPFSRWLVPVPARGLADAWLANACRDPAFGDFFNDIVTFREDNSELYTVPLPEALLGKTWREIRRALLRAKARAGIVPIGLYHSHQGTLAYAASDIADSSPEAELARRLEVNPPLDLVVKAGDRLLAFAEDEADLRKALKSF